MRAMRCHGTYIHDARLFTMLMRLTPIMAWGMLVSDELNSEHREAGFPGDEDFRERFGMINKGWAIVQINGAGAFAVYNHDGSYYLYQCPSEDCGKLAEYLAERARMYREPEPLRTLASDVALYTGFPDPFECNGCTAGNIHTPNCPAY